MPPPLRRFISRRSSSLPSLPPHATPAIPPSASTFRPSARLPSIGWTAFATPSLARTIRTLIRLRKCLRPPPNPAYVMRAPTCDPTPSPRLLLALSPHGTLQRSQRNTTAWPAARSRAPLMTTFSFTRRKKRQKNRGHGSGTRTLMLGTRARPIRTRTRSVWVSLPLGRHRQRRL